MEIRAEAIRPRGPGIRPNLVTAAIEARTAARLPRSKDALAEFVKPTVLRKPHDPAMPYTEPERANLRKAVAANAGSELFRREFAKLTPDRSGEAGGTILGEQGQFKALFEGMGDRPEGQLALQQLLLEGKLTVASKADPSRDLIGALYDLSNRELDPVIAQQKPLFQAQLYQELADPVAVGQHHKGTCAATASGQILWSMKAPTDYVDFVAQLASPRGKATLPDGTQVTRPADWRSGNDRSPNAELLPGMPRNLGRSIPSQLVEPVFMQVAYGDAVRYSNTTDKRMSPADPGVQRGGGGQNVVESSHLMEALFPGINYTPVLVSNTSTRDFVETRNKISGNGDREFAWTKDHILEYLADNATPDNPVRASVNYELSGGHAILVTRVGPDPKARSSKAGGESWVSYINPWGQYETQRQSAFRKVLTGIIVPDGFFKQASA